MTLARVIFIVGLLVMFLSSSSIAERHAIADLEEGQWSVYHDGEYIGTFTVGDSVWIDAPNLPGGGVWVHNFVLGFDGQGPGTYSIVPGPVPPPPANEIAVMPPHGDGQPLGVEWAVGYDHPSPTFNDWATYGGTGFTWSVPVHVPMLTFPNGSGYPPFVRVRTYWYWLGPDGQLRQEYRITRVEQ